MDNSVEQNHDEAKTVQSCKSPESIVGFKKDVESQNISNESCTNNINLLIKSAANIKCEDFHNDCNLLTSNKSDKSEMESENTNVSSTVDSRDDEYVKEVEPSIELNKNYQQNSIKNNIDNSECKLTFNDKVEQKNSSSENSEDINLKKKENVTFTNINGSNSISLVENYESQDEMEDDKCNQTPNEKVNCEDNFLLNDTSNSSTSSSDGLVIDQQQDIMKIDFSATERSEEKFCNKTSNITDISKNKEDFNQEKAVKEINLKRKLSFCKDDEKSGNKRNSIDEIRSPQQKVLHLDNSFLNNLVSESDKQLINTEVKEFLEQEQTKKNSSFAEAAENLADSSPILAKTLSLKNTDNDSKADLKNITDIPKELYTKKLETPTCTSVEDEPKQHRNFRFDVQLKNFENNYLYEKNNTNLSENLSKINQEKFPVPNRIIKSEEDSQNSNEVQDCFVKSFDEDNLEDRNVDKIEQSQEQKFPVSQIAENFNNENSEISRVHKNNINNNVRIDDDSEHQKITSLLPNYIKNQKSALTQKETILQNWNKMNSIQSSFEQTSIIQGIDKNLEQYSADINLDSALLNNNNKIESLPIFNKFENETSGSKLLNYPLWKSPDKYGKQHNSAQINLNKSIKRSIKNSNHNSKGFRHNSSSKKFKDLNANAASLKYHSNNITNPSHFSLFNKVNTSNISPNYEFPQNINRHIEFKCPKCLNSNFKNIKELESHQNFCLYQMNTNENIYLKPQQQLHNLLSPINNNNRMTQFSPGLNPIIPNVEDVMLNMSKESNIPNFRNILNKQQMPIFNINDKPIEITSNLNHYLTQVEQKHKNLLQPFQNHHLNHNQNLFSDTIKRTILHNESIQQFGNSDPHNRFGILNQGLHNKKKLQHLQQQQFPASFLDNENILDYPIIHDSSNIFEINGSPLSFKGSSLSKAGNLSVIKDFNKYNSRFGSNYDSSSNSVSVLGKHPIENTLLSPSLQQKTDSLEPILLKVKQNKFSPILPPEQLLNKLSTTVALSTSLSSNSSASSSFQEMTNLNNSLTNIKETEQNLETSIRKPILSENNNNFPIQIKNLEKENKTISPNQNTSNTTDKIKLINIKNNGNLQIGGNIRETFEKKTKKLFLCSSCGSYHENWNLFLHMREMHKRHICLVCLRMFPTAEQLTVHLEMKHDMEQNHFESQEKLIRSSRDSCYLMCCTCEHIFTEHEEFFQHVCANYLEPCTLCGLLGKHAQNCKYGAHDCKKSKRRKINNSKLQQTSFNDVSQNQCNEEIKNVDENAVNGKDISEKLEVNSSNQEQQQLPENNHCDTISNKQNNINFNVDQKESLTSKDLNMADGENCSGVNNDSDSDSNNKFNEYLEHFNYNDNDLINLYKSNRLANLAKQKEKEEAEAKSTSPEKQTNYELMDSASETEEVNQINDEKFPMPKLTLKISKQLLNQAQNLADDSEEHSSTESTDAEENDECNEAEDMKSDIDTTKESNDENLTLSIKDSSNSTLDPKSSPNPKINEQINLSNIKQENLRNPDMNEQESEKKLNEKQFEESKSDSDMDIDVTCNQGGDVAPITTIELKQEKINDVESSSITPLIQSKENMSIDETSSQLNIPETSNSNESFSKSNEKVDPVTAKLNVEIDKSSNTNILELDKEINDKINTETLTEETPLIIKQIPSDGIELANDDVLITELNLDAPLDKISMVELLRIMLKKTYTLCLFCNHARRIAVNGNSLALHMLSIHRFSATVDSITAEELLPGTIITKLKSYLNDLNDYYFNMETYCNKDKETKSIVNPTIDEKIFECFSCRFSTKIHKELYLHNRKMHLRTAILCIMCRSNFYSYSEILCHICPGAQHKVVLFDIKFRCCICDLDEIPSAFRLMVHFRKAHFACDVCLENCHDQSRLSSHVWKHKLHHLCYRCGISYRNKPDITKHLFWKHGTESILCKRCLQKRWPHVYHFCVPPSSFVCDICNLAFTRAMYLKVHKRLHSGDAPYPCTEDNCDKKFISRRLLLKHVEEHQIVDCKNKEIEPVEDKKEIKENIDIENQKPVDDLQKKDEKQPVECLTENKKNESNDVQLKLKKKKKSKRSSDTKETLEDLNLQAPNLSESGSSDDSDSDQPPTKPNSIVPNVMLSPLSEQDDEDDNKREGNPEKIIDIWNNFKTFQATQSKVEDEEVDENNMAIPTPILHVVQSDHDYCKMFKTAIEKNTLPEAEEEKNSKIKEGNHKLNATKHSDKSNRSLLLPLTPSKKKQKSAKKVSNTKSGSDSSSSDGSSSSSDSSCTCGSNCSCSSSSDGSSSDSSSSSDTDSSSSEGKKRIAAKRAAKEERRRNRLQSENSSKANNSDVVDVVTTDVKPEPKLIEPVIFEDDLETDESDTDEDFYDEHPQKLASELLAEKRRQLMKQTCMSPSHNFDIVENSRPSTPSLPEDVYGSLNSKEKKVKVKKKKRERKTSNKVGIPQIKLNMSQGDEDNVAVQSQFLSPMPPIQTNALFQSVPQNQESFSFAGANGQLAQINSIQQNENSENSAMYHQIIPSTSNSHTGYSNGNNNLITSGNSLTTQSLEHKQPNLTSSGVFSQISNHSTSEFFSSHDPAPIDRNFIRHSTESSSDASANLFSSADNSLKRSKRARRPNRFYGYSSDDETASASLVGASGVFKPIPPPNLTWRKEDLPTPPRISLGKSLKSPGLKTSSTIGNKKSHLFPKKKDNSNKKERPFGSKLMKSGISGALIKPRIPSLKIKPVDILSQIPPSILDQKPIDNSNYQNSPQPPPVVEPINSLPSVPVHHIDAAQFYPSSKDSFDSDSESDEDKLTIPLQTYNSDVQTTGQIKSNKKPSMSRLNKSNQGKTPKNKNKNNPSGTGARTSYNAKPHNQMAGGGILQNIAMEINEPTPPPKEKRIPPALLPNPDLATLQYFKRNNIRYPIRPPAGARPAREGESVYCYCRCPYDEVSEMIACDGDECMIEWFHFECVGILVAPQGKWFCAECKPNQQIFSSTQSTILQQQQNQYSTDGLSSNGSPAISGFNASSDNNSNSGFGTNFGSMGY